jgi:hypothetical protein
MSNKDWITSREAAAIMSANSGHTISMDYVRRLANMGLLRKREIHERTSLYSRADVERYKVQPRGDGSVRRAARKPEGARAK